MEFREIKSLVQNLKQEYAAALRDCPMAVVEDVDQERDWLGGALKLIVPDGSIWGFANATSLLDAQQEFGMVIVDGDLSSGQHGPQYMGDIRKKFPGAVVIARTGNQLMLKQFQDEGVDLAFLKGQKGDPFDEIEAMLRVVVDKKCLAMG